DKYHNFTLAGRTYRPHSYPWRPVMGHVAPADGRFISGDHERQRDAQWSALLVAQPAWLLAVLRWAALVLPLHQFYQLGLIWHTRLGRPGQLPESVQPDDRATGNPGPTCARGHRCQRLRRVVALHAGRS